MKKIVSGAALASLVSTALSAQTVPAAPATATAVTMAVPSPDPVAPLAPPPMQKLALNSGTPITLAVSEEVNSSTHKEGEAFKLTVLNDVTSGNTIVIPRGTPSTGEITWRTGKGAFGKSGKIEFSLRSIDLNGKRIPVTGDYRQEGEGNTVATGIGIIAIGVFAGFITGKRARLPVGRELMAQLAQPVAFTADGQLDPSFDSDAAMATADAKTPIGKCRAEANGLNNEGKRKSALKNCYAKRME